MNTSFGLSFYCLFNGYFDRQVNCFSVKFSPAHIYEVFSSYVSNAIQKNLLVIILLTLWITMIQFMFSPRFVIIIRAFILCSIVPCVAITSTEVIIATKILTSFYYCLLLQLLSVAIVHIKISFITIIKSHSLHRINNYNYQFEYIYVSIKCKH